MPSALLSHFLLAQEMRQKQVGIGHRGRSPEILTSQHRSDNYHSISTTNRTTMKLRPQRLAALASLVLFPLALTNCVISVADKAPSEQEEKPATGAVPQKVIDDCLTSLRKQVGSETGMKVIEARRGESSFIIDVRVESAEKPWRCYHDGTKCTGTEYQGEG
jgi:hypothetical protein